VELPLLSALRNKSFSSLRAILMSPSAVPNAARHGSQSVTEAAAMDPDARCFPRYVPSVAKILKYLSNLAVIDRFTVAIATVKSDRVDNTGV